MIIGAPIELKKYERKILLTPALVQTLVGEGHKVIVQKNIGKSAGFSNEEYINSGAELVETTQDVYSQADLILKCNQPQMDEYDFCRQNQIIMANFDFSKKNNLMKILLNKKITTIDISKIKNSNGTYPVVNITSEVVGKTLMRVASSMADKYNGGTLLGGAIGVAPTKVTILGAGAVGFNAAKDAASVGADVSIVDKNPERLRIFENLSHLKIKTFFSNPENIKKLLPDTDILICAVKRQHKKLPPIVTAKDVSMMKKGSMIIDAGLATGNISVETMDRVLTIDNPTYEKDGIIYFCVADIASMSAKTSSVAVSGVVSNYVATLARNKNLIDALKDCKDLSSGVITYNGEITNEEIAEIFEQQNYELSMLTGF